MSDIGLIIESLHRAVARVDEVCELLYRAQGELDALRERMRRVLADSQSPEVARAHQISAATVEHLTTALMALMTAGQEARHRATTL